MAPKELDQPPLRCRVLEELEKNRVRVYALDVGHTLEVNISELKVISDYLASIPARVGFGKSMLKLAREVPCSMAAKSQLFLVYLSRKPHCTKDLFHRGILIAGLRKKKCV